MDSYQIVVGSEDCPLNSVVSIVRQSSAIQNEWSTFARRLDVSSAQIKRLNRDYLLLDKISYEDLLVEVLEIWIAKQASEATLASLLQVVEEDCEANDAGELLRLEYKLPCKEAEGNPSIEWKDLSPAFQKRVIKTFQHFTTNSKATEVLPKFSGAALVSLMRGKKPHVLSLPEELSYYVSRTVVTRNIISDKIFEQNSSDIFLFTGVDRGELSRLAKNKLTGGSREQLQNGVNVKFMILDQENHFERICGRTNHPVHLLKKEGDGKLRWMKSKGEMDNLRKYVDQKQDELDEGQFCNRATVNSIPVLICDSPGMGKSVLLAQVGHRLVQLHPDRTVLFIVLSEFIKLAKSIGIKDMLKMIDLTLKGWTGGSLPHSHINLDQGTVSIELLLDGYDEVDMSDRKLTLEILQTISKSFKCIRMWITSRPHLMEELENSLNILGYNIRPFHEENQVHFLSSFWSRKVQLDQEKAKLFAKQCLKSLKAAMSSTDHDIAGIPLQCLLIGEVYEDDAVEYAKLGEKSGSCATIEIEIGTITNLYSQLVKIKFKKYKSPFGKPMLKNDDLMTIHAHLSLELFFPPEYTILGLTKVKEIDIDEVMKGGVLTSTQTGGVTFLHRTFAEYFVAWFILDKLQQEKEWTPEILNLFITIMSCSISPKSKFTHPVICYFLNSMLANIQLEMLPNNFPTKLNDKQLLFLEYTTRACIEGNFVQIFKLLDARGVVDMLPSNTFNFDLLLIGVRKSSVELVKLVLARFERHQEFDLEVQKATLQEAVKKGKFSIVEFLIKEKRLRGIVENWNENTNLVCDCVEFTMKSSEEQIKERILALQMLVEINRSLVDGIDGSYAAAPLLSYQVHVELLIELVRLGANVLVQNISGTVLHRVSEATDFHKLVMSIPVDHLKTLVHLRGSLSNIVMTLNAILMAFDPLPGTLDVLHAVGADFNFINGKDSVLAVAIKSGRNAHTIRKLVELGARVKTHSTGFWRPARTTNLLHVAAESVNVDAVGVLLEFKISLKLNVKDENGLTPLDHAIDKLISPFQPENRKEKCLEICSILIQRGGRFKKVVDSEGESLLHRAAVGNLESVKLLVQLGLDVNGTDKQRNTPLHLVAQCDRHRSNASSCDRYSIVQHLIEKGANPRALNKLEETPFHAFLRNKHTDLNIFRLFKSIWYERSWWTPTIATLALGYVFGGDESFTDKDFEDAVRECETHRGDFNWRDSEGNSLLHLAASNGKGNTVKYLIEEGFYVNSKNYRGQSPLHMAALSHKNTCLEVIKCLIENGANRMAITERKNILHFAALGRADTLKYFLELGGVDVNGKDSNGNTPLHCIIHHGEELGETDCRKKCRLLIQHDADVNIKNEWGLHPIENGDEEWGQK